MVLYDLKNLRDFCIIDVEQIDAKLTTSLDQFMYNFPEIKTLAYAYLKYSNKPIKISTLHLMFKQFNKIEWFDSVEHLSLLKSDEIYKKVVSRYVRNKWTWISSTLPIQSHLFDAKYLLIGTYQKVALECSNDYYKTVSMHYCAPYNNLRSLEFVSNNELFIERNRIESEFFNELLRKFNFNQKLIVKWYYKFIEFYDTTTKLTLQFELNEDESRMMVIWPRGTGKQCRYTSSSQIFKLLQRYPELFNLYQTIFNSRHRIAQYLTDLINLNIKYRTIYDKMLLSTVTVLEDLYAQNEATYIDNERIDMYFVHHESIERVGVLVKKGRLRLYRRIKILNDNMNRHDELMYCSYRLPQKDIESQARELIQMGFMNIGDVEQKHTMYDYELLATRKSSEYLLQFLKLPAVDAMKLFTKYEDQLNALKAEVQYIEANSIQTPDTRVQKDHFKEDYISTYFEYQALCTKSAEFIESRKQKLNTKRKRIREFVNRLEKSK